MKPIEVIIIENKNIFESISTNPLTGVVIGFILSFILFRLQKKHEYKEKKKEAIHDLFKQIDIALKLASELPAVIIETSSPQTTLNDLIKIKDSHFAKIENIKLECNKTIMLYINPINQNLFHHFFVYFTYVKDSMEDRIFYESDELVKKGVADNKYKFNIEQIRLIREWSSVYYDHLREITDILQKVRKRELSSKRVDKKNSSAIKDDNNNMERLEKNIETILKNNAHN